MTNKTVTMSRELAERMLKDCPLGYYGDELRALLAAPVVERQEPVAYLVEAYDDIAVRRTILSRVPFDDSNREMREWAKPWLVRETPLYTSPPAPIAVVLPERRPIDWMENRGDDFSEGWNACVDKVKELNQ